MTAAESTSHRTLVLAPHGRDGALAVSILNEAGLEAIQCANLETLCDELERGAAVAVVVEEALHNGDLSRLSRWIDDQPPWSDVPFVLLAQRGGGLERNPAAGRLSQTLGNASFLERPFHPTTLVSMVRVGLRGRLKQYEARARMEEIRRGEALLERRVAERTEELEAANRQLAAQIVEREKVESALRQANRLEAVGQLTSGVAHDFNNLLMVVLSSVRLMKKSASDPGLLRRLDMVMEAAQRGAKLTAQMLSFSRRQKLEPRAVDLNETVASMHELLKSSMGGSVHLKTDLAEELWPAMIDPTQIELVILNLAINARDAMDVGGALTIRTGNVTLGAPVRPEEPEAGDYVMVSVSDTGSGMSEEVLGKAFEPFFTTKEIGKGTGLGLSQVFGLAKQSGGGVRIRTRLGEGTSVNVYLPRAEKQVQPGALEAVRLETAGVPGALVLLVDDDDAVRDVTASMLEELGYRVVEAGSGGRALEELDRNGEIVLALLDFAMPGMNGAELAREVRARRRHLPVLFASGYANAALAAGVSEEAVLEKPFDLAALAEKVSQALAGTDAGGA